MARNGTGGYTLPVNSWNPAVNGAPATVADWNSTAQDIQAAIQQSVSSDGQTPMTGNLNMNGNKITNLANASASGDAVSLGRLNETDAASLIGYMPAGVGAVASTVQEQLRNIQGWAVNVKDAPFYAKGDGVTDDYSAFSSAPDKSFVPSGTYKLTASIIGKTFYSFGDVSFVGSGSANVVNLVSEFNASFQTIDSGVYPATSNEYKSEPTLLETTTGKVFCFYRIGPGHQADVGDTGYLVYRVYNRLTNTWGSIQTLVNRAGFDSRNQIAGVTPTGRIIVAYYQCEYTGPGIINGATDTTKYRYSDDDGITWSSETSLSQYCPYITATNVPFGKIVSFANGNLLISIYNYHTIFTLKSTDNGATWGTTSGSVPNPNANITTVYTTPVLSDDNITEPTLVKIDENNLVCLGRCIPTGQVVDGTATFTFLGIRRTNTTRYEVDQYVNTSGLRVYKCTVAGTTSAADPTHTSGTAKDGTVTWQYVATATAWAATTAYVTGDYVITYSNYAYQCAASGTTGSTASIYSKLGGNETQLAYFKSVDGGVTWGSAQYVTWTANTFKVTNSPPKAIVRGDTVDIVWFSRSPEWSLYYVRMSARGFFENPAWAFSKVDGEPRRRIMRSFLAPLAPATAYGIRVNVGYADVVYLPWSSKIMASWYDCPTGNAVKTTLYSTVIDP